MAKKLINEKITTTHQLSVECTLDVDKLAEGMIIGEIEDEGEKDLAELIKKFNGQYVKIVITNKIEEEPTEE
ncbi:hypothetical protein [Clostridium sp.]|uniref:hypothetical protein n=1 Tax=Clostridium sp. TaxID=1506 RepID=UPI0026377018|nr:hypothetical protein [Clostridium sp.]